MGKHAQAGWDLRLNYFNRAGHRESVAMLGLEHGSCEMCSREGRHRA